jgi:hypothetical protein
MGYNKRSFLLLIRMKEEVGDLKNENGVGFPTTDKKKN